MKLPKDFTSFAKGVEMRAAVRKRAAEIENEDAITASMVGWHPRGWPDEDTPFVRPSPQLQAMQEIDAIERRRDADLALVSMVHPELAERRARKLATATAQLDETERQNKPMTLDDYLDAYEQLKGTTIESLKASDIGRRWLREMDRAREEGFVIERRILGRDGSFVLDDMGAPETKRFWNTCFGVPCYPHGEQS